MFEKKKREGSTRLSTSGCARKRKEKQIKSNLQIFATLKLHVEPSANKLSDNDVKFLFFENKCVNKTGIEAASKTKKTQKTPIP